MVVADELQYKPFYVDNITTICLFYSLRSNVQKYMQGNRSKDLIKNIIDEYLCLLSGERREKFVGDTGDLIISQLKKRKDEEIKHNDSLGNIDEKIEELKEKALANREKNLLLEQIKEDMRLRPKTMDKIFSSENSGDNLDNLIDSLNICSIGIGKNSKGSSCFDVVVEKQGKEVTIELSVCRINAGKKNEAEKSLIFWQHKKGIKSTVEEFRKKYGTVVTFNGSNENITEADFKKLIGVKGKLSKEQKKDFELLNLLDKEDFNKLKNLLETKARITTKYDETINSVEEAYNKNDVYGMLESIGDVFSGEEKEKMLKGLVEMISSDDNKEVWSYMHDKVWVKGDINQGILYKDDLTNGQAVDAVYDTYYRQLKQEVVSSHKSEFERVFDFDMNNKEQMRQNVKTLFKSIVGDRDVFGNDGIAEIMAEGIFDVGMRLAHGKNYNHLDKMNLLLNEFGINIKFEELEVDPSCVQSQDSRTSSEIKRADRDAFNEEKDSNDIKNCVIVSKHHYFALRLNQFLAQNLNRKDNFVDTGVEHLRNIDLHALVHIFDRSEILMKFSGNELRAGDSVDVRRYYQSLQGGKILYPILQLKNENGKYEDVMPDPRKSRKAELVSDDKTPVVYAKLPPYCESGGSSLCMNRAIFTGHEGR